MYELSGKKFQSRMIYWIPQSYANITITTGQKLNLKLDGINGLVDRLIVMIRASTSSGSGLRTLTDLNG